MHTARRVWYKEIRWNYFSWFVQSKYCKNGNSIFGMMHGKKILVKLTHIKQRLFKCWNINYGQGENIVQWTTNLTLKALLIFNQARNNVSAHVAAVILSHLTLTGQIALTRREIIYFTAIQISNILCWFLPALLLLIWSNIKKAFKVRFVVYWEKPVFFGP